MRGLRGIRPSRFRASFKPTPLVAGALRMRQNLGYEGLADLRGSDGCTGCGLTSAILTFFEAGPYPVFLFCRILLAVVIGLLSTWVSERWVLRDANACRGAARPCETQNLRYGGEGFPLALVRSRQLATIVLYNVSRPDFSKIAICCLFHRLVIVGRGLNHLDEATAASRSATVQSASQTA